MLKINYSREVRLKILNIKMTHQMARHETVFIIHTCML